MPEENLVANIKPTTKALPASVAWTAVLLPVSGKDVTWGVLVVDGDEADEEVAVDELGIPAPLPPAGVADELPETLLPEPVEPVVAGVALVPVLQPVAKLALVLLSLVAEPEVDPPAVVLPVVLAEPEDAD